MGRKDRVVLMEFRYTAVPYPIHKYKIPYSLGVLSLLCSFPLNTFFYGAMAIMGTNLSVSSPARE